MGVRFFLTVLMLLSSTISGCGGSGNGSGNGNGNGTIQAPDIVTVSPDPANLEAGGSPLQVTAVRKTATGTTVETQFTWQSDDLSIATVDPNGLVQGKSVGVTTITAMSETLSGVMTVGVVSQSKGHADLTLSGTASYEDKIFNKDGFTGELDPKPIRNALVQVVAIDGFETLATTGSTGNLGAFSLSALDNSSRRGGVYLRIVSRTVEGHNTKIEVRNNPSSESSFSVTSVAVDDSVENSAVRDILATATGIGGAFNILDTLSDASEFIQKQACPPDPVCLLPLLTAYWEPGSAEGTFYDGQSAITILGGGGSGGDADEYDDSVIIHEYGHFTLSKFSHDDSLGGIHGLTENDQDIRLSWSEGWANFFSSAVRNESVYVDTAEGGVLLSFDLEDYSSIQTTLVNTKAIYTTSEVAVAGVLWDVFDGLNPGESDALALSFGPIWETVLKMPPLPTSATMEAFWLAFEAAQPASTNADFQTIMAGRQIKLFEDGLEGNEVSLVLGDTSKDHTLYLSGDTDTFSFTAAQGTSYTVRTLNLNNGADTFLKIEDSSGTFIDSNDNPGNAVFTSCTVNQLGFNNCPRNGPADLAASVTFSSLDNETLKAVVSRSPISPPSAGQFGAYDIILTSP